MSTSAAQDSSKRGWSWGANRNSTADSTQGESTPLLASSSSHSRGPNTEPLAPPPSSAPPPPPPPDVAPLKADNTDDTSQSALSSKSKSSSRSKRRKNVPDPTVKAVTAAHSHIKNTVKKAIKKKFEGPRKSIFHMLLDVIRLVAALSSLMMLGMQIAPLIVGLKKGDGEYSEFDFGLQVAVRMYIMVFCIFFILVEARLPYLKRFFSLNWILRGFLYSFIGIIGMEQDLAIKVEDYATSSKSSILGPDYVTMFATLFMSLTTWLMISTGIVYMILGVACMQPLYERMENEHREKVLEWKREKKMEKQFKRQKEEYKQYEIDRNEGRGEWYDDIPDA